MNALTLDEMDSFLATISHNDGLGVELAAHELTRTGVLVGDPTRPPVVEHMIVLLYERALRTVIQETEIGPGTIASEQVVEIPLSPATGEHEVHLANALDQYRRDGWKLA